jgi:hypothetical protein
MELTVKVLKYDDCPGGSDNNNFAILTVAACEDNSTFSLYSLLKAYVNQMCSDCNNKPYCSDCGIMEDELKESDERRTKL